MLGYEETVPIMRYVVQQICNENVELDEGKLMIPTKRSCCKSCENSRRNTRHEKRGAIPMKKKIYYRLLNILQRCYREQKCKHEIVYCNTEYHVNECSALLEENKRLGASTLQENDIMSARRFIRQDNAI